MPPSIVVVDATETPGAAATFVVAGDGQSAGPLEQLPSRLEVRMFDGYGNRVPGVPLVWTVTEGEGTLPSATSATGPRGVGSAWWVLGEAGNQRVTVEIQGLGRADFGATVQ